MSHARSLIAGATIAAIAFCGGYTMGVQKLDEYLDQERASLDAEVLAASLRFQATLAAGNILRTVEEDARYDESRRLSESSDAHSKDLNSKSDTVWVTATGEGRSMNVDFKPGDRCRTSRSFIKDGVVAHGYAAAGSLCPNGLPVTLEQ